MAISPAACSFSQSSHGSRDRRKRRKSGQDTARFLHSRDSQEKRMSGCNNLPEQQAETLKACSNYSMEGSSRCAPGSSAFESARGDSSCSLHLSSSSSESVETKSPGLSTSHTRSRAELGGGSCLGGIGRGRLSRFLQVSVFLTPLLFVEERRRERNVPC